MLKEGGKYFKIEVQTKDEIWLLCAILSSLYDDGYKKIMLKIGYSFGDVLDEKD